MVNIDTERLRFKRLTVEDSESLFQACGDPEVLKYWLGGPHKQSNETKHRILEIEKHRKTHAFGDWGIIERENSELIGFGGLHYIQDMTEVNIGYVLKKSWWRKGLAYEACRSILNFGFHTLELAQIVAVIWPDNIASTRLVEKCGLELWKKITWKGGDRLVYRIKNSKIS